MVISTLLIYGAVIGSILFALITIASFIFGYLIASINIEEYNAEVENTKRKMTERDRIQLMALFISLAIIFLNGSIFCVLYVLEFVS